jgi:hypothetical protein
MIEMKLTELVLAEWDKTFKTVAQLAEVEILQLNLVKQTGMKPEGRRNLIAVDKSGNVKWIAEVPEGDRGFGSFNNFAYKGKKLRGWYGGSIFIEINIETGKIVQANLAN